MASQWFEMTLTDAEVSLKLNFLWEAFKDF